MSQLNGIDEAVCRVQTQGGNAMSNDEVKAAIEPPWTSEIKQAIRRSMVESGAQSSQEIIAAAAAFARQLNALADEPAVCRFMVDEKYRFRMGAYHSMRSDAEAMGAALKALAKECGE